MSMDSGRLSMSATAIAGCPSFGHRVAQRPSGAMVPAGGGGAGGAAAPCCADMGKLTHRPLVAAWACASAAKAAVPSGVWPGPVEMRTPSTSSRSYSANTSGKWTSMPIAQPKRRPSTSKVTGPGRHPAFVHVSATASPASLPETDGPGWRPEIRSPFASLADRAGAGRRRCGPGWGRSAEVRTGLGPVGGLARP
jgi:hypothetical protein